MSWTGSETERRSQGSCLNYGPFCTTGDDRYTIPIGTAVSASFPGRPAVSHTTKVPLGFDRYDSVDAQRHLFVFRHEGWLITVPQSKVRLSRSERDRLSRVTHLRRRA